MKHLPTIESCASCGLGRASGGAECPFHDVAFPAGSLLLTQGETPTTVWHVREGSVLVSSLSVDGEETACSLRGPGAMLGLEALTTAATAYEAWALSDVVVCRMDVASFRNWLGPLDRPAGVIALKAIEENERQRDDRVVLAGRAEVRVARFLLERLRFSAVDSPLPFEQQILARMLGMKPETLSRALQRLREKGALAPGRVVRVVSRASLESAASDDT